MSDLGRFTLVPLVVSILGLGFGASLMAKALQTSLRGNCGQDFSFWEALLSGEQKIKDCREQQRKSLKPL